ncbi:hypothetical protein GCM10011352_34180 [Marinobacterium zhoushanense]|uniref:Universal stress protein family protein n=1 Tax=Marinobacterium zhoushanense TaxID=1679163 RepID=A0ABQ1KSC1_9GAMM|nr:hypothetical protein [Marinobacterium zhoushanense]GGC05179.1 hypothetical protein GCM10011352_34180 [Marinobacterium zhoushanense]
MIRRLILRLDPRYVERSELAIYAALARTLNAELLAQLEEDESLDELAALPFATEICRAGAISRPLNRDSLHRRSERLMRQLRTELEEIARGSTLHWQLIRTRRSAPLPTDPETALLRAAQPLRTASVPSALKPHMAVIHSGDDASERALAYARRIADSDQIPLLLLALPDSPWHRAHALPEGVSVRTDLVGYDPATLRPMLRAWQVELILIPAGTLADPHDEERLARQLPGVALLITP